ncbi:hypothetical protein LTR74_016368 [Friedmanniomyces endolithicus]|nr:hypothetical protein LTR74_016368 [Friedmanniomyces endolithicus]
MFVALCKSETRKQTNSKFTGLRAYVNEWNLIGHEATANYGISFYALTFTNKGTRDTALATLRERSTQKPHRMHDRLVELNIQPLGIQSGSHDQAETAPIQR